VLLEHLHQAFHPENHRISGQLEERTHVGNDFVLLANVHPFKGVFADLESVSR
jgi:hypothetical protein